MMTCVPFRYNIDHPCVAFLLRFVPGDSTFAIVSFFPQFDRNLSVEWLDASTTRHSRYLGVASQPIVCRTDVLSTQIAPCNLYGRYWLLSITKISWWSYFRLSVERASIEADKNAFLMISQDTRPPPISDPYAFVWLLLIRAPRCSRVWYESCLICSLCFNKLTVSATAGIMGPSFRIEDLAAFVIINLCYTIE